ncbi:UNVERIFIED_CONTAM: hypothetical protein NY100_00160 [Prevotella sp. 15_C9]
MSKTETCAVDVKAAYVCPRIVCYATESESSLCVGSGLSDGGHKQVSFDGNLEEEDQP